MGTYTDWAMIESKTLHESWEKCFTDHNCSPLSNSTGQYIQNVSVGTYNYGRIKCQSCGQWGDAKSTCGFCGSPTE